jgi:hypothetical protein
MLQGKGIVGYLIDSPHLALGTKSTTELLDIFSKEGRAIAQAVIRRLLTAAVRVRVQVNSCGIYGGQSFTGSGYSEYYGLSCHLLHRLLHTHHHLLSGAGRICQIVPDVPIGLSLTATQETTKLFSEESNDGSPPGYE